MKVAWSETFRIIHSRYPFISIFDHIASPNDLAAVIELEGRTNDRLRDEIGDIALVRPADRIAGPGTTPIMAAFTHARPSRFTDGSYGVYYAAQHRESAIFETVFHLELFYRDTAEESADVDMRVYVARITGTFDDLLPLVPSDPRLDPSSYAASRAYARPRYDADDLDGIAFPSVRDPQRRACVACFRPRSITACRTHSYLTYRWDGTQQRVTSVFDSDSLAGF